MMSEHDITIINNRIAADRREKLERLRDEFAMAAMNGIVGSIDSEENYIRLRNHALAKGISLSQWIANDSYKQADAMLAAREQYK